MNDYYEYNEDIFSNMPLLRTDDLIRQASTIPVLDRPTLKYGDRGEYVSLLQTQLKQLMFYNGKIDGIFGSGTQTSVKAFQVNNKITADGIVGADTWSALVYLYAPLSICGGNYYTVQSGDTLWGIAKKYNITVDELMRLNNLSSSTLSIGQKLIVPSTAPSQATYTVQSGDSLWSIAKKFNTTVDALKSLNNLSSNLLSIGQILKV